MLLGSDTGVFVGQCNNDWAKFSKERAANPYTGPGTWPGGVRKHRSWVVFYFLRMKDFLWVYVKCGRKWRLTDLSLFRIILGAFWIPSTAVVHWHVQRHASISSNRISYSLGLRGASASVDTACSSSLVALHIACKDMWEWWDDGVERFQVEHVQTKAFRVSFHYILLSNALNFLLIACVT